MDFERLNELQVDYIYHIADIHIRNFHRHQEYTKVFKRLYKIIKSYKTDNSIIYLAGDIVHAKTDMSPELVKITSEFLTNLAKIHPVIIIPGNHDANLDNKHRLDVISPIVDLLDNDNIFYFKDSGLYETKNIVFSVMSLLNDEESYIASSNIHTNKIKIALYHGSVINAITETGFVLPGGVQTNLFEGYDYVLLGDIHKHQYLTDRIAYAGSLIQQDMGESINKGIILWNLKEHSSQFIPVENEYGYITIDYDSQLDLNDIKIPPKSRVRLFPKGSDLSEVSRFIQQLKAKYPKLADLYIAKEKIQIEYHGSMLEVEDIRNINIQYNMIKDFLIENYPTIEPHILELVKNINININKKIDVFGVEKYNLWKLKSLEFDNVLLYGPGNRLDFNTMRGIHGLFAPNRTGKSSLLDAVLFSLYDKTTRAYKASRIMNNQKNIMKSKVVFELGGDEFSIIKSATRSKKSDDASVKINFKNESKGILLNGDRRQSTNAEIRKYIGTFDDFVLTSIITQRAGENFIDMKQSDRKNILSRFLQLEIFDLLYTNASDILKTLQGKISLYENRNFVEELESYSAILESKNKEHISLIDQQKIIESNINDLEAEVRNYYYSLHKINDSKSFSMESLETELEHSKSDLEKYSKLFVDCNEELERLREKVEKFNSEFDRETVEKEKLKYDELINKKQELIRKCELIEIKMNSIKDRYQSLKSIKYNESCGACLNNKKIIDEYTYNPELVRFESELSNIESEIVLLDQKILQLSSVPKQYDSYKSRLNEKTEYSNKIFELSLEQSRISSIIESTNRKIVSCEDSIDYLKSNEAKIEENNRLKLIIKDIETRLNEQKNLNSNLNSKLVNIKTDIRDLEGKIQSAKKDQFVYHEQLDIKTALLYYMEAVKRDGIPYYIISKSVPIIEKEINDILGRVVNFRIALELDGKNINGYLVEGDKKTYIELLSGMEHFIMSISIRVALINISRISKPNFFFIDEGFGTLDATNLNSMNPLFEYLRDRFDFVIIISHLQEMRDMVDNLIEIEAGKFPKINHC